jgi:hypothetical protein
VPYYTIAETLDFTNSVYDYFGSDEALLVFQESLIKNPTAGDVIKGTGGLRKIRWADPRRGKGKRGGLRLIYLYVPDFERLLLLDVYGKDEQDDLSVQDCRELGKLVTAYQRELQQRRDSQS